MKGLHDKRQAQLQVPEQVRVAKSELQILKSDVRVSEVNDFEGLISVVISMQKPKEVSPNIQASLIQSGVLNILHAFNEGHFHFQEHRVRVNKVVALQTGQQPMQRVTRIAHQNRVRELFGARDLLKLTKMQQLERTLLARIDVEAGQVLEWVCLVADLLSVEGLFRRHVIDFLVENVLLHKSD